jgi:hypothetical protein
MKTTFLPAPSPWKGVTPAMPLRGIGVLEPLPPSGGRSEAAK